VSAWLPGYTANCMSIREYVLYLHGILIGKFAEAAIGLGVAHSNVIEPISIR
jgi:hypothetical protein